MLEDLVEKLTAESDERWASEKIAFEAQIKALQDQLANEQATAQENMKWKRKHDQLVEKIEADLRDAKSIA